MGGGLAADCGWHSGHGGRLAEVGSVASSCSCRHELSAQGKWVHGNLGSGGCGPNAGRSARGLGAEVVVLAYVVAVAIDEAMVVR